MADFSQRVASLAEAHRETMSLIAKLRKIDKTGPGSEGAETVALIHHNLKESEQDLEVLYTEIEDEPSDEQKTILMSKWNKLSEDTKIARVSYRKAQMEVKRNMEELKRSERERLLGHKADRKRTGRSRDNLSQEDVLVGTSSEITTSLKRTHALMSAELSRSRFATETLAESTLALKDLSTRYSTLDDILLKSRRLITDLVRKNKSDGWYYEKALYIMIGTVIWLFIRRFLYGPFYLLVWLPLKLSWWLLSWIGVFLGVGEPGREFLGNSSLKGRGQGVGVGLSMPDSGKVQVRGIPPELPTNWDKMDNTIDSSEEVKETLYSAKPQYGEETATEPEIATVVMEGSAIGEPTAIIENKSDSLLEEMGQMIENQRYGQPVHQDYEHDEL